MNASRRSHKSLLLNAPLRAFGWGLCALLFLGAAAQAQPSGQQLLSAMRAAEQRVSYSATETITRADAPTVVARVQKSGGKRRVEYSAPAIMKGDLLIDDGQNLWRYHRAEKSAVRTKTSSVNTRDWKSMGQRATISNRGQSTLMGRSVWEVAISSRDNQRVLRRMWIDDATKIRLRSQSLDASGKVRETTSLSNLKIGAVPATAFRWAPPAGTKVSNAGTLYLEFGQARRQANWLRAPAQLPSGYAFESAVVDEREAWLRYSNGVRRFSIFQQRTNDKSSKSLSAAGAGWYWQRDGMRFVLAGLPKAQAEQVAASVR